MQAAHILVNPSHCSSHSYFWMQRNRMTRRKKSWKKKNTSGNDFCCIPLPKSPHWNQPDLIWCIITICNHLISFYDTWWRLKIQVPKNMGNFNLLVQEKENVRKRRRLAVETVSEILYKNTLLVTDVCTFTPNGQNGSITVLFPSKNNFWVLQTLHGCTIRRQQFKQKSQYIDNQNKWI